MTDKPKTTPLTNTPQHMVPPPVAPDQPSEDMHRKTGPGTAPPDRDVADPHPSDEGDPYDERRPDAVRPRRKDIGPNPAAHGGTAPPRPGNAENEAHE